MRILSVVDSFKGTLSSKEISKMIQKHFTKYNHEVDTLAISDGGEGFIEAIQGTVHAKTIEIKTEGPLGEIIDAHYLLDGDTAYIELNQSSGLTKITKDALNPLKTSTYGLGLVIKHAIQHKHVKHIIMGIGGSSTNDGGAGMLQALGVKFYRDHELITEHMNGYLIQFIHQIDTTDLDELIKDVTFLIASDVDNPLLGVSGCSYIYAPQKGANKEMIGLLDQYMCHYAEIIENHINHTYKDTPGSGAAGGVGFAALSLLNAKIVSGVDFVMKHLNVDQLIQKADLVIVGEGRIDDQTLRGKAPIGIAKLAKTYHKKVIAICAIDESKKHKYMDNVYAIVPTYATKEASLKNPKKTLQILLENIQVNYD